MIDTAYFLAIFFIFIRLTSFFLVATIFFPNGTPPQLKGVLAMIIAFAIASTLDYSAVAKIQNDYMIVYYLVSEVLCGVVLGFIVNVVFEMVRMAGLFIDMQVGFSMMNVVDPTSTQQSTILGTLSYYIAAVLFFITDGHHVLIACLIKSFNVIPIGHGIVFSKSFEVILNAIIQYFEIGIRIALPIIILLLIVEIAMALISRSVPQINVMILGIPIKIAVGLITFIVVLPITYRMLGYAFKNIDSVIEQVLKSFLAAPVLLFFSKDDKTEEPTGKKLGEARKKGQIARSKDVNLGITLIICTLLILLATGLIASTLKEVMQFYLQGAMIRPITEISIKATLLNFFYKAAICILPVLVTIAIGGVVGSFMQVGFLFTTEPLKLSLGKLNPINGFKNLFSKKSLLDMIKNIIVVSLISLLAYRFVIDNYYDILHIGSMRFIALGNQVRKLVVALFFRIALFMVILAVIDFVLQKRIFKQDMRMTKQEVKDEYKQMEGDPKIKGKIRQKQREIASRRMMESVPDATVVITNPTHLAIAIKYEDGKMGAPKVVAKGADFIAIKIKEIAKENKVPIMENKPLARMLYEKVEVDEEVPHDMYQAVAEILVVVYKLKKKR